MSIEPILAVLVAVLLSAIGAGKVRTWATSRHILDIPNDRSSHETPTPRGGGIAIVCVSVIGVSLAASVREVAPAADVLFVLTPALIVSLISWIDDVKHCSASLRFAVHLGMATAVVAHFGGWTHVSLGCGTFIDLGRLGPIVTVLWIVGLTNAYNFMDGIDGLAALQAIIAGIAWAWIGFRESLPLIGIIALLLAASSAGFISQNWPPARLFMGDVGSAFLGFMFATLSVVGYRADPSLAVTGVLLMWPFVFDTVFTVCRRALRGERVYTAHRSHLYQRLTLSGLSHRSVTLLYGLLAFVGALGLLTRCVALVTVLATAMFLVGLVVYRERKSA